MASMRLTAKRQATLPRTLCEDMHVGPGDEVLAERRVIAGETLWVLRPRKVDWSWIGSVRTPTGVSHDMDDVRASVAAGRRRGRK